MNIVDSSLKQQTIKAHIESGNQVFPTSPISKKPVFGIKAGTYHKNWGDNLSPQEIEELFQKYPNSSIGLRTGCDFGFIVVDGDGEAFPEDLKEKLRKDCGMIAKTQSGNYHYYYTVTKEQKLSTMKRLIMDKNSAKPKWQVDIRAERGYVLCPPSVGYEWDKFQKMTPVPDWILDALKTYKDTTKDQFFDNVQGKNEGEGRHTAALNVIGTYKQMLRRAGYTGDDYINLLKSNVMGWNSRYNNPPLEEEWLEMKLEKYGAEEAVQNEELKRGFSFESDFEEYQTFLSSQGVLRDPDFTTGFGFIDQKTWGYHRKKLHLICGVPGSGKSLTMDISALENAKRGKKVIIFSTESQKEDVIQRLLIYQYNIESIHFVNKQFTEQELNILNTQAFKEFEKYPIKIYDDEVGIEDITKIVKRDKPDIIYIDHFQECYLESESHHVAKEFVRKLKRLAQDENIAVVLGSQPNEREYSQKMQDGSYKGKKSEITASDVRTTKALWHVPHLILILNCKDQPYSDESFIKISIGKNKITGSKSLFYYRLDTKYLKYYPATRESYNGL